MRHLVIKSQNVINPAFTGDNVVLYVLIQHWLSVITVPAYCVVFVVFNLCLYETMNQRDLLCRTPLFVLLNNFLPK